MKQAITICLAVLLLLALSPALAEDDLVRQSIKIFNVPLAHSIVGPVPTLDTSDGELELTMPEILLQFANGFPIIRGYRTVPATACDTERDCESTRIDMCTFLCPECDPDELFRAYSFDIATGECKWTCWNYISGVAVCIDKKDPGAGKATREF